jgi:DNA-directed RNA polymerase II subunit RPB1
MSLKFTGMDRYEISNGLSVVEITNPTMNVQFKQDNGLHDTRMGSFRNIPCDTCGESVDCPGHFGHIALTYPVPNPAFLNTTMLQILKTFCYMCSHAKCECTPKGNKRRKIDKVTIKIHNKTQSAPTFHRSDTEQEVTFRELYRWIANIPKDLYLEKFPSHFEKFTDLSDAVFIHNLPILPICTRPPRNLGGEWKPSSITFGYINILRKNTEIRMLVDTVPDCIIDEQLGTLYMLINMQFDNSKVDSSKNSLNISSTRTRIDGKEGYLRKNIMGKRCDFSARMVLSGDPNLGFNEVGLPTSIAEDLTIPLTITTYNIEQVKRKKYNIKYIQRKNVRYDTEISTIDSIQVGDIVERSLIEGDIVAVNRQPTLHRGSMVACYVRIFECSTIRLNYSTMVPLNADCDGDCLCIHVPQDDFSRAELELLMLPSMNIVSPQDSKPLVGCTQDSLLGCWKLSQATLSRNDMMNIVYAMDLEMPDPMVITPVPLFSGLQIVQLILEHLGVFIRHYTNKAETFLIHNNVAIYGTLDKQIIGNAENSLFHVIYLQKDHLTAAKAIHLFQKAATAFLDMHGFSIGLSDCIVENVPPLQFEKLNNHLAGEFMAGVENEGPLCEALGKLTKLEASPTIDNSILDCIYSGSKGSIINFNQITRMVGQQNTDTGRIPHEFNHRTLPHFHKHDHSVESRGFVKESFIKGLDPKSFFFHSIAGRVGIISTSIKTATTGYASRKMVKCMEQLKVHDYGNGKRMVKDSTTGGVVQFEYGEDSYDGTFLCVNKD